jgi:hypothetical protein
VAALKSFIFSPWTDLAAVEMVARQVVEEETETRPTVTALFATDFPSGHFRRLNPGRLGTDAIGGGAYVFTTGLNLSKCVKPFIFYGNLWYSMQTACSNRGEDDDGNSVYFRNYPRDFVTVNLAAVPHYQEVGGAHGTHQLLGRRAAVRPSVQLAAGSLTLFYAGNRIHGHGKILPGPGGECRSRGEKYGRRGDAVVVHGVCFLILEKEDQRMKRWSLVGTSVLGLAVWSWVMVAPALSQGRGQGFRPCPYTSYLCPVRHTCKPFDASGKVAQVLTENLADSMRPGMAVVVDTKTQGRVHVHLGPPLQENCRLLAT